MAIKNIAVVCGGYSKEEVISIKSANQISQVIDTKLFLIFTVLINNSNWVVNINNVDLPIDKNDFSFMLNGIKTNFDVVFMAIHGTPGEDGKLQSYFEMLRIPVTTSNPFVSALTFNKFATKIYLKEFGVLSAKAVLLRNGDDFSEKDIIKQLGLPIFVKPNNGGSSFGITKVKEATQLPAAIKKSLLEDDEVIIEEFIEGREFTCGVFISENDSIILPITEIISKTEYFDFEAKYKGLSDEITPANISDKQAKECKELSLDIYKQLNCSGVVRIDFLLKNNRFYFMEVNTVPGMSQESIIPQQVKEFGLSITNFYTMLIEDALSRVQK